MKIFNSPSVQKTKNQFRRYLKAQSTLHHWMGWGQLKDFGFFVPYSYKEKIRTPDENDSISWIEQKLLKEEEKYLGLIEDSQHYKDQFRSFETADPSNVNTPRFNQSWFPGADGAMAYTLVRKLKPSKVIEVGSGHSTRWLRKAAQDEGINTFIHSIDPVPRREIDNICDDITRSSVTDVDSSFFDQLKSGDFLFIDCSHIAMPGSDVDMLFTQVLPRLPKGVIIHVHDIFLPFGYPNHWHWRGYNEQMLVLALLGTPNAYEILWPSYWMAKRHRSNLEQNNIKLNPGAIETSFWLKKECDSAII